MAKKSKTELEYQLRARRIDRIADVIGQIVRYGSFAFCVYIVSTSLKVFAGQHTLADVAVKLLGQFGVSEGLMVALAGGGVFYGYRQSKLRRDTIQSLAPKVREREEAYDQGRSSSMLGPRGTTPKEPK